MGLLPQISNQISIGRKFSQAGMPALTQDRLLHLHENTRTEHPPKGCDNNRGYSAT